MRIAILAAVLLGACGGPARQDCPGSTSENVSINPTLLQCSCASASGQTATFSIDPVPYSPTYLAQAWETFRASNCR